MILFDNFTQRDLRCGVAAGILQVVRRALLRGQGQPGQTRTGVPDMNKILATAVASLAFIGAAYAADLEGTVASVDPATRSITLEDGKTYVVPESISVEGLAAGAKVKVTVDDTTGAVTAIEKAS
jgi:hypothetical protein